jgi:hypothetical protein
MDKKLWDKTAGGNQAEYYPWVKEIKKNRFVLAGTSYSGRSGDKTSPSYGSEDFWLVRIVYFPHQRLHLREITVSHLHRKRMATFTVYPNPVKDALHIQTNEKLSVTLTDQSGKTILFKKPSMVKLK